MLIFPEFLSCVCTPLYIRLMWEGSNWTTGCQQSLDIEKEAGSRVCDQFKYTKISQYLPSYPISISNPKCLGEKPRWPLTLKSAIIIYYKDSVLLHYLFLFSSHLMFTHPVSWCKISTGRSVKSCNSLLLVNPSNIYIISTSNLT